jgi:hypothetical protein
MQDDSDVRSTMPATFSRIFTHLTGKAGFGQSPWFKSTPYTQLGWGISLLTTGVAGVLISDQYLATFSLWRAPVLLLCWLLIVSGARFLTVIIHHQCVHHTFSGSKFWDRVVGELISTVTFTQDFSSYQADHISDHHSKKLATIHDPDFQLLRKLGFRPGISVSMLWKRLWWTLFSPAFHAQFLWMRFKSNFVNVPVFRRFLALAWWSSLIMIAYGWHLWTVLLVGYLVPVGILYNCSSLLQFLCEHQWARTKLPGESDKLHLARLTTGRFCGEAAPSRELHGTMVVLAWVRWWLRMLLIHLPVRVFVLVGDLPVHDRHHRAPCARTWPDAIYERQRDIEKGCPGWPELPTEIWGLVQAINCLFEFWSSMPATAGEPDSQPPAEVFVPYPATFGAIDKPTERKDYV